MNAIILILPLIIIRYGLPALVNTSSLERAQFFPPVRGLEKWMLTIYKITIFLLILSLLLFKINLYNYINYTGVALYLLGMLLYLKSILDFAGSEDGKAITKGLYRFSRNPMYVAFFIYFLGINLLIDSILYFSLLLIFQISVHFIILSEERWCLEEYGRNYRKYLQKVRRYV